MNKKIVRNAPSVSGRREANPEMLARIVRLLPEKIMPVLVERSHTQQRDVGVTQKSGWWGRSRTVRVVETRVWTQTEHF